VQIGGPRFVSEGANPRAYEHDESLFDLLGQASGIRVHARRITMAPNSAATLKFFEAAIPGRPAKVGKLIGSVAVLDPNAVVVVEQVEGPFGGRVEAILEVAGASEAYIDIGLTLILDD